MYVETRSQHQAHTPSETCACVYVCVVWERLYLYLCRERAPFCCCCCCLRRWQRCPCNWSRRIHLFVSILCLHLRFHLQLRLRFSLCHCLRIRLYPVLLIVAGICPMYVCICVCVCASRLVIRGVKWIFYFYYYDFIVFRVSVFWLLLVFSRCCRHCLSFCPFALRSPFAFCNFRKNSLFRKGQAWDRGTGTITSTPTITTTSQTQPPSHH